MWHTVVPGGTVSGQGSEENAGMNSADLIASLSGRSTELHLSRPNDRPQTPVHIRFGSGPG